jgi:hypothetical protein
MESKPKIKKTSKKPAKKSSPTGRKVGYIVSIVFMLVFLYILRHLRDWGVTFLTEDFEKCLFYIELSIYASIGAQVLLLLYDNRWFRHLIQGITNVFGALSLIMLYVIFPFNFGDANWVKWIKIGLLILFILIVISIVVEIVKGVRYLINDPEKE